MNKNLDTDGLENYARKIPEWLNREIFQTAFIHRSYLNEVSENIASNERLEFLGDSVLAFIISTYLYNLRPGDAEGELTSLRSYIVKTQSLAKAAETLNLGSFLKMSNGEELSGGRENTQLLANTYEAFLGAIYLDQGIEEATKFVKATLLPLFEKEIAGGPPKDSKSRLQELTQNLTKQSPKYKIVSTKGPDHAKEFTVGVYIEDKLIGKGMGLSKHLAEEAAASEALKTLAQNPSVDESA